MTVPLVVLAVLSVVGGLVGPPLVEGGHPFARWLAPVFAAALTRAPRPAHEVAPAVEWALIALSVLVAAAGIVFAFRAYLWSPETGTRLRERFAGAHRTLLNKYWVDELYERTVVRAVYETARSALWRFWDVEGRRRRRQRGGRDDRGRLGRAAPVPDRLRRHLRAVHHAGRGRPCCSIS